MQRGITPMAPLMEGTAVLKKAATVAQRKGKKLNALPTSHEGTWRELVSSKLYLVQQIETNEVYSTLWKRFILGWFEEKHLETVVA